MLRSTLFASALSLATFSVASALPSVATPPLEPDSSVILVGHGKGHHSGHKRHYSNHGNWNKHYHYGGRYWGHRYSYRPYGWATLGCIAVGPVWYCP